MKFKQKYYGPLINQIPQLRKYLNYSEQAYVLSNRLGGQSEENWGSIESKLLSMMMYHALNTSLSIRLLTTHAQPLEAYALLRVRLEQLIVFSYIIHAEKEEGFNAFLQDIKRNEFRYAKAIKNIDPELFSVVERAFADKMEYATFQAYFNEKSIDPDFDWENDKLKRKWSPLNAFAMCQKRDKLVPQDDLILSIKLSRIYLSIYKSASIFVHSESGIVTENFISNLKGRPMPQNIYLFSNLVNLAQIDLIQTYEVINYLLPEKKERVVKEYESFNKNVLEDYAFVIDKLKNAL